jgi:hypothetical protein
MGMFSRRVAIRLAVFQPLFRDGERVLARTAHGRLDRLVAVFDSNLPAAGNRREDTPQPADE